MKLIPLPSLLDLWKNWIVAVIDWLVRLNDNGPAKLGAALPFNQSNLFFHSIAEKKIDEGKKISLMKFDW